MLKQTKRTTSTTRTLGAARNATGARERVTLGVLEEKLRECEDGNRCKQRWYSTLVRTLVPFPDPGYSQFRALSLRTRTGQGGPWPTLRTIQRRRPLLGHE